MSHVEHIPPRYTQRVVIVPLPQARTAWIVFKATDDNGQVTFEIDGPMQCVAMVHEQAEVSWDARETKSRRTARDGSSYMQPELDERRISSTSASLDNMVSFGSLDLAFIVLPDDCGDRGGDLMVSSYDIFFTQAAAERAAAWRIEQVQASAPRATAEAATMTSGGRGNDA